MSSIIKDIENDLEHVDKEIYSIKERITNIPKENKKEFRESMRLLSVFRKDKLSLLNTYHNIIQDISVKRRLLEAQRIKYEAEAAKLLMEDVDRSEADEQFALYFEGLLERTSKSVAKHDSDLIKQEILKIGEVGDKK